MEGYLTYLTTKYGEPTFQSEPLKGFGGTMPLFQNVFDWLK